MAVNKTFVLITPKNRTAYNFRGELIKEIIAKGYTVYVTGPNRIDVEQIEALGAHFVEIKNDKNGVNIFADLCYIFALWSLLRRLKADVTLGYTIKPVIYGSIAAWLAGVKSINAMVTGVGYLFISTSRKARILKKLVIQLYRIGLGCAHSVIFQNQDDRNEFIENKLVSKDKCHLVNGSGVNMAKFTRQPFPQQLTFFMLSRIMYAKGVMEYVEAAKLVKKEHPNVRFMLLGAFEDIQDSIPEDIFRQDYIDSGIIDYFGESKEIPKFFAQSSVYVLPSYREGTPRTVLEAMAMGRAVITTDAPGCRECVKAGHSGMLVPVKSSEAVADAMRQFILNPNLVEQMGEASYNYCNTKFNVDLVNKDMTRIMFKG